MVKHSDKRSRYKGAAQWDIAAGVGRASNTPQTEPRANMAKTETRPGENFRRATAMTKPPELLPNPTLSEVVKEAVAPKTIGSVLASEKPSAPSQSILGLKSPDK